MNNECGTSWLKICKYKSALPLRSISSSDSCSTEKACPPTFSWFTMYIGFVYVWYVGEQQTQGNRDEEEILSSGFEAFSFIPYPKEKGEANANFRKQKIENDDPESEDSDDNSSKKSREEKVSARRVTCGKRIEKKIKIMVFSK